MPGLPRAIALPAPAMILFGAWAVACGSQGSAATLAPGSDASLDATRPPVDAGVGPDGAPDGGADAPSASCSIEGGTDLLGLVGAVVAAMRAGGNASSAALQVPSAADRDSFAASVVAILDGDESGACALPAPYRLLHLTDPRAGALRVLAELDASGSPSPSLYWGTYAAPVTPSAHGRLLAIEAPHPIFDTNTELQAADTFVQGSARYYLLAGAHRCADAASSGCSGTTDACGAAADYRISDAAHTEALPFHAIHAALSAGAPSLVFLQLHGNAEPCPAALVSDSSGTWSDAGPAGALAGALSANGVAVGECGVGYPTATCDLCGTDNVQARMTAGSADACTTNGPISGYGRFVHVEQQLSLRLTPDGGTTGYQPLIDAVLTAFPAQ
jgi:hypothetical protein